MASDRLRVVIVVPTYVPESYGGAEQQTRRLAGALAQRGVQVTVLAPRLQRTTPSREFQGPVAVRRFRLRQAPNLGGRHMVSFLRWCLCVAGWLWRHRNDYDVIHVIHGRIHAVPAAVAGRRVGKPVLIKPGRGGEEYFDLRWVRRKRLLGSFFARLIERNATGWVANSREIAADLADWGVPREQIHQIPNGIDVPEDAAARATNGSVALLSMGRLDPEKAIDQTIRAFAMLPADTPAQLTILGDGQCREELEALARALGQGPRITFGGAVTDVSGYLRNADIYVSSSASEGMSNALLEAMVHGVMPVVSRVSGSAELVEDGVSGLLFAAGDETAIATRLREALEMPSARRRSIGEEARAVVARNFSLDRVADEHIALYRSLVEDQ